MPELIKIQFQTPQDFQGFRKMVNDQIASYNIANLEVICKCDIKHVATAITQFGGMVMERPD